MGKKTCNITITKRSKLIRENKENVNVLLDSKNKTEKIKEITLYL